MFNIAYGYLPVEVCTAIKIDFNRNCALALCRLVERLTDNVNKLRGLRNL